jgi:hypothetical protein
MSSEEKTNFIIAIRNYKRTKSRKGSNFTDITALDAANEKVLLRSIEPVGNEYVGIGEVKSMMQSIKHENCIHAVFISKRFTAAAIEEMKQKNIQYVSEEYMPPFDTAKLYMAINNCVNNQCKSKCGLIPSTKSDCKVKKNTNNCKIRDLAENALFHFENSWVGLLRNDLKLALALNK